MPTPYVSIDERLNRYNTGLVNARDVPDLQSRVALYGYNDTKLDELLALRQEALDAHLAQQTEYDEQHTATATFNKAWETAHTAYMHLIKLGRILFKNDLGIYAKLTLNEDRKKTFSGWLTQAYKFYGNLLDEADALAKYAAYNTPLDTINAGLALVETAKQANITQAKETGEAQKATQDRDATLDAIDSAMSEFYALSQIACEDSPQLLEMLEIVVSDGYETKPPVIPESPASGVVTV